MLPLIYRYATLHCPLSARAVKFALKYVKLLSVLSVNQSLVPSWNNTQRTSSGGGKKTASVWEMDWITGWLAASERHDKKLSLIFTPTPTLSCLWLFSPFPSLALFHSRSQTLSVSLLPSLYLCPTTSPTRKQKGKKEKTWVGVRIRERGGHRV